ncbi:MAG TPA: VWA domain-containing protein, partial [Vicinamibacteria bacterium]|nr:VWA domain-containing protein [Vicinamibacteria bacterium]
GREGPITGLRAEDFDVRDHGVPQRLDSASIETVPLRVILAFDVSGSLKGDKLPQLKRGSAALLDRLRPGDDAALLTFADTLGLRHDFGGDLGGLRAEIDGLQAEGGTSLIDGVLAATALGDSLPDTKPLLVVFTDGQESTSWLPPAEVLEAVKRSEAVLYGVAVVPSVHARADVSSFLWDAAATTGGRVLAVAEPNRLRQAFVEIVDEFRTRYLLRYTPNGVPRAGWHELDVRVKGRSAKVLARKGYLVGR